MDAEKTLTALGLDDKTTHSRMDELSLTDGHRVKLRKSGNVSNPHWTLFLQASINVFLIHQN